MTVRSGPRELTATFGSMASEIELRVLDPRQGADDALVRARTRIADVARHLTRFDEGSALSRANAAPRAWHRVPRELGDAVAEAHRAYRETGGVFDPRILDALVTWGYDRTFAAVVGSSAPTSFLGPLDAGGALGVDGVPARPVPGGPWEPVVLAPGSAGGLLQLGGVPIDLGGIGKGLAVRWAAAELAGAGSSVLVDAGGDEWLGGPGPDGDGWKVGVEDPHGADEPVLVLAVTDSGIATSSVRRRRWHTGVGAVHHLVDPRTGLPGGPGLASVTVLHADPAWAEVWSKALFLGGAAEVAAQAEVRGLAAAWVTRDGSVRTSAAMDRAVIWRAR